MEIKKHKIADMQDIYVVNQVEFDGRKYIVAGSEKDDGILLYDCETENIHKIADHPGGHMSLIPLPEKYGIGLLAIGEFKPVFQSENAGIYLYTPASSLQDQWKCRRILDLPFVHRIEIVKGKTEDYLIAATVCESKAYTDDWSHPGAVYAGVIPQNPFTEEWGLKEIFSGLHKNHGMQINDLYGTGQNGVLVAAQEGVYYFTSPENSGKKWRHEQLLEHEISDIAAFDIDDNGEKELVTIEPFHGDTCAVYKKKGGIWERHVVNDNIAMGHALWAGKLNGKTAIVLGWRRNEAALELLEPDRAWPPNFKTQIIDRGEAPTQLAVFRRDNQDIIAVAANGSGSLITYKSGEK